MFYYWLVWQDFAYRNSTKKLTPLNESTWIYIHYIMSKDPDFMNKI